MPYDLKITGGTLVDGTGQPRFDGDIGIKDGVIVAVGEAEGPADQQIDASGAIVTPGFVDIHTHFDGQVSWDAGLTPSSGHGVTTCVMGNCGVGFAPVRDGEQDKLIELMEGVEEIPGGALTEGMSWDWQSYPEYLSAIDRRAHAIDFASQVAHDPLRFYVMGGRAVAGEPATDDDIRRMRALAAEALRAGAVGISTGRTDTHRTAAGDETPARYSTEAELRGLAAAVRDAGRGVVQVVDDFWINRDPDRFDAEFDLVDVMAEACGGRLSLSLMQRDMASKQWRQILGRVERANERGLDMWVQVAARGIGVFFGLETTLNPLLAFKSYREIHDLPLARRLEIMRDPDFKRRVLSEPQEKLSGQGTGISPLADLVMERLEFFSLRMFRLGENPDYEPPMEASLYYEAKKRDVSLMAAIYDIMLEEDGRQLVYFPLYNYTRFDLDDLQEMIQHPAALFGLSDAGAHVGTVCDASFPTFMLTHWVRDRSRGDRLGLEWVVEGLTRRNAAHMGMTDRGTLSVGQKADVNVIDLDRLRLSRPHMVADLPAGGRRLMQQAEGYIATVVSGQPIVVNDRPTGATPGRLVRS